MARSRISAIWWNRCYLELVIKNDATLTFPVCITLIAGCLIAREDTDGTLKSLLVIPISLRRLAGGKLLLCALLSLLFGAAGAAFTLLGELAAGFPGVTLPLIAQACLQIPAEWAITTLTDRIKICRLTALVMRTDFCGECRWAKKRCVWTRLCGTAAGG